MKLELVIFGVTAFLIANTYHDGKYTKMLQISKKYFKMATFAFVGFSLYLFIWRPLKQMGETFPVKQRRGEQTIRVDAHGI